MPSRRPASSTLSAESPSDLAEPADAVAECQQHHTARRPTDLRRTGAGRADAGRRRTAKARPARIARSGRDARGVYSGAVVDVGTGKALFRHQAGAARIPASIIKLLTSAAVLSTLGPEHRFTTSVVQPEGKNQIILVGGGDPYLATKPRRRTYPARASVADLAKKTAAALEKSKTSSVSLGYDACLFTGPAWNPAWPSGYGDQVTPISALWVDEGRVAGGSPGPRSSDPAGQAAKAFAAALRKQGIRVTGVRPAKAPARGGRDRRGLVDAAGARSSSRC